MIPRYNYFTFLKTVLYCCEWKILMDLRLIVLHCYKYQFLSYFSLQICICPINQKVLHDKCILIELKSRPNVNLFLFAIAQNNLEIKLDERKEETTCVLESFNRCKWQKWSIYMGLNQNSKWADYFFSLLIAVIIFILRYQ